MHFLLELVRAVLIQAWLASICSNELLDLVQVWVYVVHAKLC